MGARELLGGPAVTVQPDFSLARAAEQMADQRGTHLLVIDPDSRLPIAVRSALDIAARVTGP